MIAYVLCSILFSVLYYIQAYKTGLKAKKWAAVGLVLGPIALPLFKAQQRIVLVESRGKQSIVWLV